jgi:hypothetical protein
VNEVEAQASSLAGWVGEDVVVASFAGDSAACRGEVKSCLITDAKSSDRMRLCRRLVLMVAQLDAEDSEEFGCLLGELVGVVVPD